MPAFPAVSGASFNHHRNDAVRFLRSARGEPVRAARLRSRTSLRTRFFVSGLTVYNRPPTCRTRASGGEPCRSRRRSSETVRLWLFGFVIVWVRPGLYRPIHQSGLVSGQGRVPDPGDCRVQHPGTGTSYRLKRRPGCRRRSDPSMILVKPGGSRQHQRRPPAMRRYPASSGRSWGRSRSPVWTKALHRLEDSCRS
jgi:hypothetical protein